MHAQPPRTQRPLSEQSASLAHVKTSAAAAAAAAVAAAPTAGAAAAAGEAYPLQGLTRALAVGTGGCHGKSMRGEATLIGALRCASKHSSAPARFMLKLPTGKKGKMRNASEP